MTNSNLTHIAVVVDRSGSMTGVEKDMIGGLNEFFSDQADQPGECLVDYVQFDTVYEKVFEDRNVSKARAVLKPRGGTALLDAIGYTITDLGEKLEAKPEKNRPGKVLVVIVTDGYENSSKDWTKDKVAKAIKRQEGTYGWDFVFLGANMDAVSEGATFGTRTTSSLTYDTNNVAAMSSALSTYATTYRGGGEAAFSDEDRKSQGVDTPSK